MRPIAVEPGASENFKGGTSGDHHQVSESDCMSGYGCTQEQKGYLKKFKENAPKHKIYGEGSAASDDRSLSDRIHCL